MKYFHYPWSFSHAAFFSSSFLYPGPYGTNDLVSVIDWFAFSTVFCKCYVNYTIIQILILYNMLCESGFSRERKSMWYPREMWRDLFFETIFKYIKRGIYFKDLAYLWRLASPKNLGPTGRLEPFGLSLPCCTLKFIGSLAGWKLR